MKYQHFTPYSLERSIQKGEMADAKIINMMNVMNYLDNRNAAQHWRIVLRKFCFLFTMP